MRKANSEVCCCGVLGGQEIKRRLEAGQIFQEGTWAEECIQEASYDLRVSDDLLLFGEHRYIKGHKFNGDYIVIASGEIALLSTMEVFKMPDDVAGKVGVRFKFRRQGMLPLFGLQVAPLYGMDYPDERLYLLVSNLGPSPIYIKPGERVFTMEFTYVHGGIKAIKRTYVAERVEEWFFKTDRMYKLGIMAELEARTNGLESRLIENVESQSQLKTEVDTLRTRLEAIERSSRQILVFAIFPVAATLLGVFVAAVLAFIVLLR